EISVPDVHAGVARADVCDGALVVVEADHARRHVGDHVGSVAFAGTGLEHGPVLTTGEKVLVDDLVTSEPIVLLGDAGDRPFAGEGEGVRVIGAGGGVAHRHDIRPLPGGVVSGVPDHRFRRPFVRLW